MKNLKRQNPGQLFVAQELINKVIKLNYSVAELRVNNYYGNPSYYSVMPQEIFDALELASLQGEEYTTVNKDQFDKMIVEYDKKMKQ